MFRCILKLLQSVSIIRTTYCATGVRSTVEERARHPDNLCLHLSHAGKDVWVERVAPCKVSIYLGSEEGEQKVTKEVKILTVTHKAGRQRSLLKRQELLVQKTKYKKETECVSPAYCSENVFKFNRGSSCLEFQSPEMYDTKMHTFTSRLVSDSSPQYTAPETQPVSHCTSSATTRDISFCSIHDKKATLPPYTPSGSRPHR